jgi:hypothetical protein
MTKNGHMKIRLFLLLLVVPSVVAVSQPNQRLARTPKVTYDWQPGFVSITELTGAIGLSATVSDLSRYYYGITTVAGYQFTRNVKAGLGAGVHVHNEGMLFPLYLDARYSLSAQDVMPFFAAAGGIAIDTEMLDNTRIFINPSVGVRYVAAKKTGITFSTGLMVTTGGPNARKSFVNFKLGLELKVK